MGVYSLAGVTAVREVTVSGVLMVLARYARVVWVTPNQAVEHELLDQATDGDFRRLDLVVAVQIFEADHGPAIVGKFDGP